MKSPWSATRVRKYCDLVHELADVRAPPAALEPDLPAARPGDRRDAPALGGDDPGKEFVGEGVPWVHIDIAGTSTTDKDKGAVVKGETGVIVRTLVNFVLGI